MENENTSVAKHISNSTKLLSEIESRRILGEKIDMLTKEINNFSKEFSNLRVSLQNFQEEKSIFNSRSEQNTLEMKQVSNQVNGMLENSKLDGLLIKQGLSENKEAMIILTQKLNRAIEQFKIEMAETISKNLTEIQNKCNN